MKKLLKLKSLIMIVLLSCSINCLGNNDTSFYGAAPDSVFISYDDLRTVNSKLIELEYEKEINENLRRIIDNDKVIICTSDSISKSYIKRNNKITKQRNVFGITTICSVIIALFSLLK